jgi:hypothetical protein
MFSFKNYNQDIAIKKTTPLIWLTAFALSTVIAIAPVVAIENTPFIEHDEGESSSVIIKGTTSDVCNAGVSSGFACKNVELLARMPLASIGGGSGKDSWGWKDPESGRHYGPLQRH